MTLQALALAVASISLCILACNSQKYGTCSSTSSIGPYTLASDGEIDDCGSGGSGDNLVYYCCDSAPRYCLSAESGCYWKNYGCNQTAYYGSYNCESVSGCGTNEMAYSSSLGIYWWCNTDSQIFCATTTSSDSTCNYTFTIPTENPTNHPTDTPTTANPSSSPSDSPSHTPTSGPTSSPTSSPTNDPSNNPTSYPTNSPTNTTSPSYIPTQAPVYISTAFYTTQQPNFTINNVSINYENDYLIEDDDDNGGIQLQLQALANRYFNPGYRTRLTGIISIQFLDEEWFEKFEHFYHKYILIEWNTINLNETSSDIVNTDNARVVTYNKYIFTKSTLTLDIIAYYVLYSKYDANIKSYAICNQFDTSIFKSLNHYLFNLTVTVTTNDDNSDAHVQSYSNGITLIANSPPTAGTCVINPQDGILFETTFNVECYNWTNNNNLNYSSIYYNYFYDFSVVLDSEYSTANSDFDINFMGLGYHTITAVIMDTLSLATCVDLNVDVVFGENATSFDDLNFTNWLDNEYTSLTNQHAQNFSDILLLSQISYDIVRQYVKYVTNNSYNGNFSSVAEVQFIATQKIVINKMMQLSNNSDTQVNFFSSIASTLSIVTSMLSSSNSSLKLYDKIMVNSLILYIELLVYTNIEDQSQDIDDNSLNYVVNSLNHAIMMRLQLNQTESQLESFYNTQRMLHAFDLLSIDFMQNNLPGEYYHNLYDTFLLKIGKISMDDITACEVNETGIGIQLSNELVEIATDFGNDFVNCVILETAYDLYNLTDLNLTQFLSNFVNLEIVNDENGTEYEFWLTNCEPIILSYNISSYASSILDGIEELIESSDESSIIDNMPQCSFYNETSMIYDNNGCYVISINDTTLQCACSHLTFFVASWETFAPQIDYQAIYAIHEVNLITIAKYPTTPLVILMIIMITAASIIATRFWKKGDTSKMDKPLLAYDTDDAETLLLIKNKHRDIKVDNIIMQKNLNCCVKILKVWKIYLRNNHLWMGICCRDYGTNFTSTQRVFILSVKMSSMMAAAALFYGYAATSDVQDWMTIFYQSLCGFIVYYFLKFLIIERVPREVKVHHVTPKILPKKDRFEFKVDPLSLPLRTDNDADVERVKLQDGTHIEYNYKLMNDTNMDCKLDEEIDQVIAVNRKQTLKEQYRCQNWCKWVSYSCGFIISIVCYGVIIIYSLFFDLTCENNYVVESSCNQTGIDVSLETQLNYNITQIKINKLQRGHYSGAFGTNLGTSTQFMLSILYSTLFSFLLMSPLLLLVESVAWIHCRPRLLKTMRRDPCNCCRKIRSRAVSTVSSLNFDDRNNGVNLLNSVQLVQNSENLMESITMYPLNESVTEKDQLH